MVSILHPAQIYNKHASKHASIVVQFVMHLFFRLITVLWLLDQDQGPAPPSPAINHKPIPAHCVFPHHLSNPTPPHWARHHSSHNKCYPTFKSRHGGCTPFPLARCVGRGTWASLPHFAKTQIPSPGSTGSGGVRRSYRLGGGGGGGLRDPFRPPLPSCFGGWSSAPAGAAAAR